MLQSCLVAISPVLNLFCQYHGYSSQVTKERGDIWLRAGVTPHQSPGKVYGGLVNADGWNGQKQTHTKTNTYKKKHIQKKHSKVWITILIYTIRQCYDTFITDVHIQMFSCLRFMGNPHYKANVGMILVHVVQTIRTSLANYTRDTKIRGWF